MSFPQSLRIPLLLAALLPATALAQEWQTHSTSPPIKATPGCSGGIVYDDGAFEFGYGIGDGDPDDAIMLQRLTLGPTTELDQVCICFVRSQGNPGTTDFPFDVVLYDNDGPGGGPGTLVGAVASTATDVPMFPQVGMYEVDLTNAGIPFPGGDLFVGARWPGGPSHFLCGDSSPTTTQQELQVSGDHGASFLPASDVYPSNPPRAFGIRADFATSGTGCVSDDTTLCLNNGRFAVNVTWQTDFGTSGVGHTHTVTPDTGLLWFFNPNNIEMVVKVLNACTLNDRFWVFAGGLTNVRVDMFVTDTETQFVRHYVNPQNNAFLPIQDTNAFPTCF